MDEEDARARVCVCVHTYNGILLSHEKNEILSFATTWMYVDIMLSEISQIKTKTMISLLCGI